MYTIPNHIHLIWMGSYLKGAHQTRMIRWRKLNPNHRVYLWMSSSMIDADTQEQLAQFCSTNGIFLQDVDTLAIRQNVRQWMRRVKQKKIKNYGALSDMYRLYVLKQYGGWYFDTDIEPYRSLPVNLRTRHGFGVYGSWDIKRLGRALQYTPAILLSCEGSEFVNMSTHIIQRMVDMSLTYGEHTYALHDALCNEDVLTRYTVTESTTGMIVLAACCKLLLMEQNYSASDIILIPSTSFQEVSLAYLLRSSTSYYFELQSEHAWLFSDDTSKSTQRYLLDSWSESKTQAVQRQFFQAMASIPETNLRSQTYYHRFKDGVEGMLKRYADMPEARLMFGSLAVFIGVFITIGSSGSLALMILGLSLNLTGFASVLGGLGCCKLSLFQNQAHDVMLPDNTSSRLNMF